MAGVIRTYQKCPKCGHAYPSSKGDFPIICPTCQTQPTKFYIKIYWKGKAYKIYRSRDGRTLHYFQDAVTTLGDIRANIEHFDPGIYQRQSSTTFAAFWSRFLKKYEKNKKGTHAKLSTIGRLHLDYFEEFQMRDIRGWHIDEWWTLMQEKALSPKYINDCRQWLLRFFRQAIPLEIIERVPPFPDPLDEPDTDSIDYISEKDQLAVLEALPKYDRPIFDFLFLTGVRVNEATGFQREDNYRDQGYIIIRHTVKRDGSLGVVKNKKKRIIYYFPELVSCLKRATSGLSPYFFINKWGRRYSDDYLNARFREACLQVNVKPIPLKNATRTSFVMGLLRKGADIWQASKIVGHSDIKITEHYAEMLSNEAQSWYGRDGAKKGAKRISGSAQVVDIKKDSE